MGNTDKSYITIGACATCPPPDYNDPIYSQQFQLLPTDKAQLITGVPYRIVDEKGKEYFGRTDRYGKTCRVFTEKPEKVKVMVGKKAMNYIRKNNKCHCV